MILLKFQGVLKLSRVGTMIEFNSQLLTVDEYRSKTYRLPLPLCNVIKFSLILMGQLCSIVQYNISFLLQKDLTEIIANVVPLKTLNRSRLAGTNAKNVCSNLLKLVNYSSVLLKRCNFT